MSPNTTRRGTAQPCHKTAAPNWALIASAGNFFLALIAGPIRGIPLYWRLIDCGFGLVCGAILLFVLRQIRRIERPVN